MTKAVSLARSVSDTGLLLDGDLAAIAALSGTAGLLKKTAANTWSLDTSSYLTSITSTNITTALGYTPENLANKGAANGYASLDGSGKVPASQLPSYVDDVLEYANLAALPATGETGKLYLTLDNNKVYRWSGSAYLEIVASPSSTDSVAEGSTNLYFTNARARGSISATAVTGLSYDSTTGVLSLAGIPNNSLTNSSITINGTSISLGSSGSITTTNITEGTNLYFTNTRADTRADSRIAASSINALADVDTATTAPTNGQALAWSASVSAWIPQTISGGGGGAILNLEGGAPDSIFGGVAAIDAGGVT